MSNKEQIIVRKKKRKNILGIDIDKVDYINVKKKPPLIQKVSEEVNLNDFEFKEITINETPQVCKVCGVKMTPNNKGCWAYFGKKKGDTVKKYERIPYGGNGEDASEPCHDCGVMEGAYHHDGCDNETCPKCNGQALGCDCNFETLIKEGKETMEINESKRWKLSWKIGERAVGGIVIAEGDSIGFNIRFMEWKTGINDRRSAKLSDIMGDVITEKGFELSEMNDAFDFVADNCDVYHAEKIMNEIKQKYSINEENNMARPLSEIAMEIYDNWDNIYFGAKPYLEAMATLDKITDKYMLDSGSSVVAYFLANASQWKGEVARRIKKELNSMLKMNESVDSKDVFKKYIGLLQEQVSMMNESEVEDSLIIEEMEDFEFMLLNEVNAAEALELSKQGKVRNEEIAQERRKKFYKRVLEGIEKKANKGLVHMTAKTKDPIARKEMIEMLKAEGYKVSVNRLTYPVEFTINWDGNPTMIEKAKNAVVELGKHLGDFTKRVGQFAKEKGEMLKNKFGEGFAKAKEFAQDKLSKAGEFTKDMISKSKDFYDENMPKAKEAVGKFGKFAKDKFGEAGDFAKDKFGEASKFAKDKFGGLADKASEITTGAGKQFEKATNMAKEKMKDLTGYRNKPRPENEGAISLKVSPSDIDYISSKEFPYDFTVNKRNNELWVWQKDADYWKNLFKVNSSVSVNESIEEMYDSAKYRGTDFGLSEGMKSEIERLSKNKTKKEVK